MCICVCVNRRMKAPTSELLIGCLITHRNKYVPSYCFQRSRQGQWRVNERCLFVIHSCIKKFISHGCWCLTFVLRVELDGVEEECASVLLSETVCVSAFIHSLDFIILSFNSLQEKAPPSIVH